ncbi:hypothetical protein A2811_02795 [Candidatus Campbellbacteria bacterium RIFCSPHIGHO2_01_FULL_34_10]|uniref:VanZ-like domain-containing protein n=2 Tax=Candidatus Campbelliibacteriota TaxID=1752727 RepID=A0A1F5EMQ5_9BACT|nr:MAG: hypothetical protein A2811_02795 [Candidatus Campbellbacteria bacterium RIFCSPHIGHO2_01_FULL_34_10]
MPQVTQSKTGSLKSRSGFSYLETMRKELFIFTFILILFIASLNELAVNYYFYWRIWWFDIMMHFLGGLWVGLSALWFYYSSGFSKKGGKSIFTKEGTVNKRKMFFISLFSGILIGLGWEIFEFIIEVDFSNNYIDDTLLDLLMDMIGAIMAFVVVSKFYRKDLEKINKNSL